MTSPDPSESLPETPGLTFPIEGPFAFDAPPDPIPTTPPEEAPDDSAQ
jgi:hypothetical protein